MKVAISGLSSSGKSTLAKHISSYFSLKLYSAGSIFRSIADERGISLVDLSKSAEREVDEIIDKRTTELCNSEDGFVIEGRLSCYFCKDAFKIYLFAPLVIRAERYAHRENISKKEALKILQVRDEEDLKRYEKVYGIKNYHEMMCEICDLIIDTSKYSINEMCILAFEALKERFSLNKESTKL